MICIKGSNYFVHLLSSSAAVVAFVKLDLHRLLCNLVQYIGFLIK